MLIFLLSLLIRNASAGNEMILCSTQSPRWKSTLSVSNLGSSTLRIQNLKTGAKSLCSLTPRSLFDLTRGEAPSFKLQLNTDHCDLQPDPLLKEIHLTLMLNNGKAGDARFHWLRNEQPEICKISQAQMFDLKLNAKKARSGKWPTRKPASKKRYQK
jgi:hypothetical protein